MLKWLVLCSGAVVRGPKETDVECTTANHKVVTLSLGVQHKTATVIQLTVLCLKRLCEWNCAQSPAYYHELQCSLWMLATMQGVCSNALQMIRKVRNV